MEINAIKCPVCKDTIYSRARHDFRYCSCKAVSIDGGLDYQKVSWDDKISNFEDILHIKLNIQASSQDLYKDWNTQKNKFGQIKA